MASTVGITHGYAGWLQIDTARVLCREGASLLRPRNLDIPYPISSQIGGQLNYADMPTFPVVQVPAIPMDPFGGTYAGGPTPSSLNTDPNPWFSHTNLNLWFIGRTGSPEYDLSVPGGGMVFSDNGATGAVPGVGTWRVNNAKAAGFSLNIDKGAPIGFVMRWAAGSIDTGVGVSNPTTGLVGTPLQAGRVQLGGSLAQKGIIGVTLDFDTGLSANMEIDGTNNIKEQNADLPTAALTIRMNARDIDPPGFGLATSGSSNVPVYSEVGGAGVGTTAMVIGIQRIASSNTWIYFTITRAIPVDPDNRRQMRGRVIRSYRYNCLADSTNSPNACYPIQISTAAGPPP